MSVSPIDLRQGLAADPDKLRSVHARESEAIGHKVLGAHSISRYGLALCFVAGALFLSFLVRPLFPYPFLLLFFPAVMAAAWFAGAGPGLFAVLLSTLAVDYFFIAPFHSFYINATDDAYFAAFVICALAAGSVSSSKKKTEEALKEARNKLQGLVVERTAQLKKSNTELQEHERGLQLLAEKIPQQMWNATPDDSSEAPKAAPLQSVLAEVVELATSLVRCDSCFVYVLDEQALVLRASKNSRPEALDRLKLKIGEGITGWVAEHRQPVSLEKNAYEDPRFQLFNELPEDHFQAFLSVPVLSRGRLVGVINLQNRLPYRYSEREIRLLATIGFLAGAEIELARLETENSQLFKRLESRKLIERAKGVLQRELKISEEEAYLTLQRESRQRGKSMKVVAETILLHDEIKNGPGSA